MATGTITLFEKENVLMATAENISTADWPVEAPSSTSPSSVFSEEFARRLSNDKRLALWMHCLEPLNSSPPTHSFL